MCSRSRIWQVRSFSLRVFCICIGEVYQVVVCLRRQVLILLFIYIFFNDYKADIDVTAVELKLLI